MPKPSDQAAKADANWSRRARQLQRVQDFSLQARVASGGVLGVSGDLDWRQRGEDFNLRFAGPFGIGALEISGNERDVEIRTRKNTYHTDDPEAFLRSKLGWTLPVLGLRYWVLGLPSPHSDADLILDAQGRARELTQDGWTLRYDDYQEVNGLELPRRFELAAGRTRFKVLIDRWRDISPAG